MVLAVVVAIGSCGSSISGSSSGRSSCGGCGVGNSGSCMVSLVAALQCWLPR